MTTTAQATKTATAGQTFTASMVKNFGIGTRTRLSADLREDILKAVHDAAVMPGYYSETRTAAFRPAFSAINGYTKHIDGGRVDAIVCWYVREGLSAYRFVKMLARMVDANVTNMLEAEDFFKNLANEANTAYRARY
jgi:hypothetical protein